MVECFNTVIEAGCLEGTSAEGLIILIKKAGTARNIENWRPITLMTVDSKLFCKVISNRLNKHASIDLHRAQNSLPKRSIYQNLAIIRDTISKAQLDRRDVVILSLDQAKAFDRVNHGYLFHLLEIIQLPHIIIQAIKVLYTGYNCKIRNANTLSKPFPFQRGVRQGDPMSSFLYALSFEPVIRAMELVLLNYIPRTVQEPNIRLSAYADDLTIFLENINQVPIVIQVFNRIAKYSDAKLNEAKSNILELINNTREGNHHHCNTVGLDVIPISKDKIKILGIQFRKDQKIDPQQWEDLCTKAQDKLARATRYLSTISYAERAAWATQRLWPRFLYVFKSLQPSKKQILQVQQILAEAVWIGGKHWRSYDRICMPIQDGGLNMICPETKIGSIRILMLAKLITQEHTLPQFVLVENLLDNYAKQYQGFKILHTIPENWYAKQLPPVYAAALEAWKNFPICFFPTSRDQILSTPVYNSKFLLSANPPVGIDIGQAKDAKLTDIQSMLQMQNVKTRFWTEAKQNTAKAIDDWYQLWENAYQQGSTNEISEELQNKETGQNMQKQTTEKAGEFDHFVVQYKTNMVTIKQWTTDIIYKVKMEKNNQSQEKEVQYTPQNNTWKYVFSSHAPTVFKNNFWKFLHRVILTPTMCYYMKISDSDCCCFCGTPEANIIHVYKDCLYLEQIKDRLSQDIKYLGLQYLTDQYSLYRPSSYETRLANILIMAYIYAILVLIKRYKNNPIITTPGIIASFYDKVMVRHMQYHARNHPPGDIQNRHAWKFWTTRNLIATYKSDKLFVRTNKTQYIPLDKVKGNPLQGDWMR